MQMPNVELLFVGSGHGKLLIADAGHDADNITVAFDKDGQIRQTYGNLNCNA
ncbi:MAG: hypothetical protein IPM54_40575 [Polyangiaceae bacterium]|nr:hypothetical protein [Polyangiaceae bacterium]